MNTSQVWSVLLNNPGSVVGVIGVLIGGIYHRLSSIPDKHEWESHLNERLEGRAGSKNQLKAEVDSIRVNEPDSITYKIQKFISGNVGGTAVLSLTTNFHMDERVLQVEKVSNRFTELTGVEVEFKKAEVLNPETVQIVLHLDSTNPDDIESVVGGLPVFLTVLENEIDDFSISPGV